MKAFTERLLEFDRAVVALKRVANGVVNGDVPWRTMIYYVANVQDALESVRDKVQKNNASERKRNEKKASE